MVVTPNGETKIIDKIVREGVFEIAPELLLDWLKFSNGEIKYISLNQVGNIEIVVKHEDMPDHRQGDNLEKVQPCYRIDYPSKEITRTSPIRLPPKPPKEPPKEGIKGL